MIRAKIDLLERKTASRRPRKRRPFIIRTHHDDGITPDTERLVCDGEGEPEVFVLEIIHTRGRASAQAAGPKPIESMTDAEVEAEVRELEAAATKPKQAKP